MRLSNSVIESTTEGQDKQARCDEEAARASAGPEAALAGPPPMPREGQGFGALTADLFCPWTGRTTNSETAPQRYNYTDHKQPRKVTN